MNINSLFISKDFEPYWIDVVPFDINGNMYKKKFTQSEWVERTADLRYFKMSYSKRVDLRGTRKVGRCLVLIFVTKIVLYP